jgi:CDP-diacylglycerol--glycerol-3-phosphate 3-phosphatidyltransferase
MNDPLAHSTTDANWNLPNQISAARIAMSIAVFVALYFERYRTGLILFVLAAGTDWLDGFLARRWNQVTQLGRILDPLADKIVVSGAFIFLAAVRGSCIEPWMAVLVVAREMIVTVIRSYLEQQGHDFSAKWSGKFKMVLQCLAVIGSLWLLSRYARGEDSGKWLPQVTNWLVWLAIIATVYSGWVYIAVARRMLGRSEAGTAGRGA